MRTDLTAIKQNLDGVKPEEEFILRTPAQLVEEWSKSLEGDIERPLTTCIPKIDKLLRNRLRGTVGAYIGYGGTKKSLLATQACKTNVMKYHNNCTGIYSNMEMGTFQFMNRLIDMSLTVEDNLYNTSSYFERRYEELYKSNNKEAIKSFKRQLSDAFFSHYGNNLLVSNQTNMNVDKYHKLLRKVKENQVVDMLVIDGLSMMANIGTENETYTTHSKELKDLAKDHNIYIPLICHLSKGADKHTRDTMRYIRGSEKILDNVDMVFMMSLCVDTNMTVGKNIKYLRDKGWISFYDKRGTGETIDIIYNFDSATLSIEETNELPEYYEVKEDKKSLF